MMKDNGRVVSVREGLARVEVDCLKACQGCSTKYLCRGQQSTTGLLEVKNSIGAGPGDWVVLEIPDTAYSRILIRIFGSLLAASLGGMSAGYLTAGHFAWSSTEVGLIGLFSGLFLAGFGIFKHSRAFRDSLYPVITEITQQGGFHAQA